MKVLHIISSISSIHGGTTLAVLGITRALIDQGISTEIVTTNDNGSTRLDVPIAEKISYQGIPIYFCNCLPFLRKYALSNDLAQWLWQNSQNYDLLHIHCIFSYSSMIAMVIANYCHVPYIVTPHGMLCTWSLNQSYSLKNIYMKLIGYKQINKARAIHFTTNQEKEEARTLDIKPQSVIIPLGVNILPTKIDASVHLHDLLKIPIHVPIILFLSRIHPKKGLDYLIPALAKIAPTFPFHFVVAGDGKEEDKWHINHLLDDYKLKEKTHLVGFVEGEMKNLLLQGSDIFALTSHSENFGVVVLEAMAAGLPVLLTPGVALSSIVKENQLGYVAELDVDSIAQNLKEFLENRDNARIKEMSQRTQDYVQSNYSWDIIAKDLMDIYHQCL